MATSGSSVHPFTEASSKIFSVKGACLGALEENRDKSMMYDKLHKKWTENQWQRCVMD